MGLNQVNPDETHASSIANNNVRGNNVSDCNFGNQNNQFNTYTQQLLGSTTIYNQSPIPTKPIDLKVHDCWPPNKIPKKDRSILFVGRNDKIEVLQKIFLQTVSNDNNLQVKSSEHFVLQPTSKVAVCHGLGGVGKTHLVLWYAMQQQSLYQHIFWFDASDLQHLMTDYQKLAQDLGLSDTQTTSTDALRKLQSWFNQQACCLCIYDNAKDDQLLNASNCLGGKHHVLITSRYSNWSVAMPPLDNNQLQIDEALPVRCFEPKVSLAYWQKILGNLKLKKTWESWEDEKDLQDLSELLGHLPLALKQAGGYLLQAKGVDIKAYIKLYQENTKQYLQVKTPIEKNQSPLFKKFDTEHLDEELYEKNKDRVYVTWTMTRRLIAQQSQRAHQLLNLTTGLYHQNIPLQVFQTYLALHQEQLAESKMTLNEELTLLENYSLIDIERDQQDQPIRISLHVLLQTVMRLQLMKEAQFSLQLPKLSTVLGQHFNYSQIIARNKQSWPLVQTLWLQVQMVLRHQQELLTSMKLPASRGGISSKLDSDFNVASDGEYDPERLKNNPAHERMDYFQLLMAAGCYALQELFDDQQAKQWFQRALEESTEYLAANSAEQLNFQVTVYGNLGDIGFYQENYQNAQQNYQNSLMILEKFSVELNTPIQQVNRAVLLHRLGDIALATTKTQDFTRAESYYREALRLNLALGHVHQADNLRKLAVIASLKQDFTQAQALMQQVYDIKFQVLQTENHPEIAHVFLTWGDIYAQGHEIKEEKTCYQKAANIYDHLYGERKVHYPYYRRLQQKLTQLDHITTSGQLTLFKQRSNLNISQLLSAQQLAQVKSNEATQNPYEIMIDFMTTRYKISHSVGFLFGEERLVLLSEYNFENCIFNYSYAESDITIQSHSAEYLQCSGLLYDPVVMRGHIANLEASYVELVIFAAKMLLTAPGSSAAIQQQALYKLDKILQDQLLQIKNIKFEDIELICQSVSLILQYSAKTSEIQERAQIMLLNNLDDWKINQKVMRRLVLNDFWYSETIFNKQIKLIKSEEPKIRQVAAEYFLMYSKNHSQLEHYQNQALAILIDNLRDDDYYISYNACEILKMHGYWEHSAVLTQVQKYLTADSASLRKIAIKYFLKNPKQLNLQRESVVKALLQNLSVDDKRTIETAMEGLKQLNCWKNEEVQQIQQDLLEHPSHEIKREAVRYWMAFDSLSETLHCQIILALLNTFDDQGYSSDREKSLVLLSKLNSNLWQTQAVQQLLIKQLSINIHWRIRQTAAMYLLKFKTQPTELLLIQQALTVLLEDLASDHPAEKKQAAVKCLFTLKYHELHREAILKALLLDLTNENKLVRKEAVKYLFILNYHELHQEAILKALLPDLTSENELVREDVSKLLQELAFWELPQVITVRIAQLKISYYQKAREKKQNHIHILLLTLSITQSQKILLVNELIQDLGHKEIKVKAQAERILTATGHWQDNSVKVWQLQQLASNEVRLQENAVDYLLAYPQLETTTKQDCFNWLLEQLKTQSSEYRLKVAELLVKYQVFLKFEIKEHQKYITQTLLSLLKIRGEDEGKWNYQFRCRSVKKIFVELGVEDWESEVIKTWHQTLLQSESMLEQQQAISYFLACQTPIPIQQVQLIDLLHDYLKSAETMSTAQDHLKALKLWQTDRVWCIQRENLQTEEIVLQRTAARYLLTFSPSNQNLCLTQSLKSRAVAILIEELPLHYDIFSSNSSNEIIQLLKQAGLWDSEIVTDALMQRFNRLNSGWKKQTLLNYLLSRPVLTEPLEQQLIQGLVQFLDLNIQEKTGYQLTLRNWAIKQLKQWDWWQSPLVLEALQCICLTSELMCRDYLDTLLASSTIHMNTKVQMIQRWVSHLDLMVPWIQQYVLRFFDEMPLDIAKQVLTSCKFSVDLQSALARRRLLYDKQFEQAKHLTNNQKMAWRRLRYLEEKLLIIEATARAPRLISQIYIQMAKCYWVLNDPNQAKYYFEKPFDLPKHPERTICYGHFLFQQGDYKTVIQQCQYVLSIEFSFYEIENKLNLVEFESFESGVIEAQLGQYLAEQGSEAIDIEIKALAHYLLTLSYFKLGQKSEAQQSFQAFHQQHLNHKQGMEETTKHLEECLIKTLEQPYHLNETETLTTQFNQRLIQRSSDLESEIKTDIFFEDKKNSELDKKRPVEQNESLIEKPNNKRQKKDKLSLSSAIEIENSNLENDQLREAKKESMQLAEQQGQIGPKDIKDFKLKDVKDEGNCFFEAIVDQLQLIKHDFLKAVPEGTAPHDSLRLKIQGKNFSDQEWVGDYQGIYEKIVKALNVVLAVIDTRNPAAGFVCYYFNENGEFIINVGDENASPIPIDRPIIRLAATGNHYLSVLNHPKLKAGALKEAFQAKCDLSSLSFEKRTSDFSNSQKISQNFEKAEENTQAFHPIFSSISNTDKNNMENKIFEMKNLDDLDLNQAQLLERISDESEESQEVLDDQPEKQTHSN